jgi:hypothetical protein
MKTSEYNYNKAGRPVSWNEENYAFANERMNDKLLQAEYARKVKAATEMHASSKRKVVLQWVTAALSWINIG